MVINSSKNGVANLSQGESMLNKGLHHLALPVVKFLARKYAGPHLEVKGKGYQHIRLPLYQLINCMGIMPVATLNSGVPGVKF